METYQRLPYSDSAVQWSRTEVTNFDCVNDPVSTPDDDATYTATTTQAYKDYFNFASFNLPVGSIITNVKVTGRFRRMTAGGAEQFWLLMKVNGVSYHGPGEYLFIGAYFTRSWTHTVNPNTGQPWTIDDANGIGSNPLQTFGYEFIGFGTSIRCTQVYIEVNFTPPIIRLPLMRDVATDCLMRDVATGKLMRAVEFESGEDCECFITGRTPKYYTLTFSGVALCQFRSWPGDVSLNQKWLLEQYEPLTTPCFWRYLDANWLIFLNFNVGDPLRTWVRAYTPGVNYYYFSFETINPCFIAGNANNEYDGFSCSTTIYGKYGSVLIEPGDV